jgi:hypothetical protein
MKRVASLLLLPILLITSDGEARRLPSSLAEEVIQVVANDDEWNRIVELHTGVPFLERQTPELALSWRNQAPAVGGIGTREGGWNSRLISKLSSNPQYTVWTLRLRERVSGTVRDEVFTESLRDCLEDRPSDSWPGHVLRQAGVEVSITPTESPQSFTIKLSQPVGVLPILLEGCQLRPGSPLAPYALKEGILTAQSGSPGRGTLIRRIRRAVNTERADLQMDAAISGRRSSQIDGPSDVVLLLVSRSLQDLDILGLDGLSSDERGERLAITPLLAALHRGRGSSTSRLLPSGVGFNLPLESFSSTPRPAQKIVLSSDPPTHPSTTIPISWPEEDELLGQLAQRLALLACAPKNQCVRGSDGLRLLRFRPQSQDPAVALLELASESPDLQAAARDKLADPRLLSGDPASRIEAALELEKTWLETKLIVPVLTTQHWLAVNGDLRGVRLDAPGIPRLLDAWTTSTDGGRP